MTLDQLSWLLDQKSVLLAFHVITHIENDHLAAHLEISEAPQGFPRGRLTIHREGISRLDGVLKVPFSHIVLRFHGISS